MLSVENIKQKITPLLRRHNVKRAGLFGSVVSGLFTTSSDIDILIELGEQKSLLDFTRIKLELEDLLSTPVDLVEYGAIKPRLKKYILSQEVRVYGE